MNMRLGIAIISTAFTLSACASMPSKPPSSEIERASKVLADVNVGDPLEKITASFKPLERWNGGRVGIIDVDPCDSTAVATQMLWVGYYHWSYPIFQERRMCAFTIVDGNVKSISRLND